MLSVNFGTLHTSLIFLWKKKKGHDFHHGPSQKIFCFSSALTRCLSTTQVQIPKIRVASPKTRHAVTVLFWPLERQKTPEFRGFFGVASFKMCKHGRGDRIRTCGFYVPNVALYQAEPHLDISSGPEPLGSRPEPWQRYQDLNPDKQSQSLVCYHYTIPLHFFCPHTMLA